MTAIYVLKLEKVVSITKEEENAIYDSAETLDSNPELFLPSAFFSDSDFSENRKELEAKVTPETLKVLKELSTTGESFVICN
ncbi:MAG TPA: hypothetical protein ACFYD6_13005 [Candidatus Brocadiia bacterium]|nr:hypothetical protein [Candidatus Brocadiales bacterium]